MVRLYPGRHTRPPDGRAWRIGGEGAVRARLARLGPSWRVVHPVADGGIDHVVVGPAGVFTVSAKHHPRASVWVGDTIFMVNGTRVPYIGHSRAVAQRAGELLTAATGFPVSATGVIALTGVREQQLVIRRQPVDRKVLVVGHRQVRGRLSSLPAALSAERVQAIYDAARRCATWHARSRAGPGRPPWESI
jgi:hypothetical protein